MIDEKEFRERIAEIKRRIPEAFEEDPHYYFLNEEECNFYDNIILKERLKNNKNTNTEINRVRKSLGLKPLDDE